MIVSLGNKGMCMKVFFIIVNSLLGALLLFNGAALVFESPLIGVLFMVCGLVLFPLSRFITHKVTKVAIKTRYRAILCLSTFFAACGLIVYEGQLEAEKMGVYLAQQQAREDAENIAYFKENKDSITEGIVSKIYAGAFKDALYEAEKYLVTNDPEIKSLYDDITVLYEPNKKHITDLSEIEKKDAIGSFGEPPAPYPFIGYTMINSYLEKSLNDPDSLDMQECGSVYKGLYGWLVSCTFRAKNGFGALIKSEKWFVIKDGLVLYTREHDYYD